MKIVGFACTSTASDVDARGLLVNVDFERDRDSVAEASVLGVGEVDLVTAVESDITEEIGDGETGSSQRDCLTFCLMLGLLGTKPSSERRDTLSSTADAGDSTDSIDHLRWA